MFNAGANKEGAFINPCLNAAQCAIEPDNDFIDGRRILMKTFLITLCVCFIALASAPANAAPGAIELPASGQTLCYNDIGTEIPCAGTGQDGDLLAGIRWPDPRFTDNTDGTVTDNLTGLMWLKDANCISTKYTESDGTIVDDGLIFWPTALAFVIGINDGATYPLCGAGYTDWRLPNINEIKSLVGYDQSSLAPLPASHPFTNVLGSYWSSTTHSNDPRTSAFGVSMYDGHVSKEPKSTNLMGAWPVRDSGAAGSVALPQTGQTKCYDATGAVVDCATTGQGQDGDLLAGTAWPNPRFTDNGDGTVTDELTGLIWFADVAGCMGTDLWENALAVVADLNDDPASFDAILGCDYTGNHDDWRLANIRELESIVHYDFKEEGTTYGNTSDWLEDLFVVGGFDTVPSFHWSSTSDVGVTLDKAFTYTMGSLGVSGTYDKDTSNYIWPVRGGVYGDPDITVAPTTVDFGSVTLGESATQDITVSNDGTYYLDMDATAALAAPFSIVDNGCANQTLAPEGTCTVTVGYDPAAEVASTGNIEVESDDPDEATVTVSLSGTGTATPNNPPAAFELLSPENGATNLIMPVTMTWNATTDPDGDTVSYDINYCEDSEFAGCDPILNVAKATAQPLSSQFKMLARLWVKSLVIGPLALAGCGGSNTAANEIAPSTYIATDLEAGTTYYWKVIANDPNGGVTESTVWSFTTQQINAIGQ